MSFLNWLSDHVGPQGYDFDRANLLKQQQLDEETQNMAARNLLSPAASQSFALQRPAQFTAGMDADNPDASNGAITAGGAPITGNLLSAGNRGSLLASAMGPKNLLTMQIAQAQPNYQNVDGIGLVNTHAPGGPQVVIKAGPKPGDLSPLGKAALDLRSGLISPDEYNAIKAKETAVPGASERETLGEPQTVTGDDGKQHLVRFGNRGSIVPVSGYQPKDNAELVLPKRQPGQSDAEYMSDLQAVDPGAANLVDAIANYQQPMPSTRSGKVNPLATAALALNPNLDNKLFKARNGVVQDFSNGKMADMKQFLNRTISNLGTWYDSVSALNNHGGLATVLNAPENAYGGITGNGLVTSAKESSDTLATEARNVFAKSGNGGLEEFRTWQGHVNPNASPSQQAAAKDTFLKNFDGQLDAMATRWNSAMPDKKTKLDFLSPAAVDTIQRIAPDYYKSLTAGTPAAAQAHQTVPGQPAQAAPSAAAAAPPNVAPALPPGMVRQVGTYKGHPVYVDAQGGRHVDAGSN